MRQLEYLVALARLKHFSRAAAYCKVSQPSLSSAIKQLEEELGTPIVLRHRRFQGFTLAGQRAIEWAKRIIADRNALCQEISVLRNDVTGRLRLGVNSTSSPILPFLSRQFSQLYPGITLQISFLPLNEVYVRLANFEIDAAFTYIEPDPPVPLSSFLVHREHLVLLAPASTDVPSGNSISWAKAAELPLCLLPPVMYLRQVIDSTFAEVGCTPVPLVEVDSITDLALHAEHAGLATIVPAHIIHVMGSFPNTRVINLVQPSRVHDVGLVWTAGEPMMPMAKVILNLMQSMKLTGEIERLLGPRMLWAVAQSA